jgi:ATP-binding cassette subfamily F protein uup
VLDEPTNDLDIDTLELLEDLLQNYPGTVFLVSHDRTFLDNVVTSTIAFEGNGLWREYEGGVQDWLLQSRRSKLAQAAAAPAKAPAAQASAAAPKKQAEPARRKLSYKEQRELESLPSVIQKLEEEQKGIQAALSDGSIYASDAARAAQLGARNSEIDDLLMSALERWESLGGRP